MKYIEAIATYQCPGCVNGSDPRTCKSLESTVKGCGKHVAGTLTMAGAFALGLPKGFCRFGASPEHRIDVYESWISMVEAFPNLKTIFSVPVWKHLDGNGNTIVRWFSPRTNCGWSTVVLGDHLHEMPNAIEITQAQIDDMD